MPGKKLFVRYSDLTTTPVEFECRVVSLKKFLPRGSTENGGKREDDLIQVWTDMGMRTIGISNVYRVR